MSDEEDESLSEAFSASEDEWKPGNNKRGGESSDDDDSDFEHAPAPSSGRSGAVPRKREQKAPSGIKGASVKKRKPMGQSLRSKLYNKYRPPPKTITTSPLNSPSASSSSRAQKARTASKNAQTPNDSGEKQDDDSSSDSSIDNYLVNPEDLDLQSSFFNPTAVGKKEKSPAPVFDCNAGIANISDSDSEDNNDSSIDDNAKAQAYDFHNLLESANNLERAKEAIVKQTKSQTKSKNSTAELDVMALLALGENTNNDKDTNVNENKQRALNRVGNNDDDDEPSKLSKTKSTRIKRHTKTRPASTVVATGDTDDSDWEDVSGENTNEPDANASVEIHVNLPTKQQRTRQQKTQDELELSLKRQLNHEIKKRQLNMHKASLVCWLARSYNYNKLLNSTVLMQEALKLLPSRNVYPTERGTEVKYFQSFVVWFKTVVKLNNQSMFPPHCAKRKAGVVKELQEQMRRKEARSKQDMIYIFIILARAMGMHCRLVVNLQPLPLKPPANKLIPIELNKDKENAQKSSTKSPEEAKAAKKPTKKAVKRSKKIKKESEEDEDDDDDDEEVEHVEREYKTRRAVIKKENSEVQVKTEIKTEDGTRSKPKIKAEKDIKAEQVAPARSLREPRRAANKPALESQRSSSSDAHQKPNLAKLKRAKTAVDDVAVKKEVEKKPKLETNTSSETEHRSNPASKHNGAATLAIPEIVIEMTMATGRRTRATKKNTASADAAVPAKTQPKAAVKRSSRSRSKSPKVHISPKFLSKQNSEDNDAGQEIVPSKRRRPKAAVSSKASPDIVPLANKLIADDTTPPMPATRTGTRALRKRGQKAENLLQIPQLDGANDSLEKLRRQEVSDEDFDLNAKPAKKAPILPKAVQKLRKDRLVLSTDDEAHSDGTAKRNATSSDMWIEMWCDIEEVWTCIDLFKGKVNSIDTVRKAASSNLAYVFAFQNDLSLKDVTARYCPNWATTVRKGRIEKAWLDELIEPYLGRRTKRDMCEDMELRLVQEQKPMPTTISGYKDHPLYALERHLLKFQAIYPPNAPTLGFIRGEAVYSRDCVHVLHSREIWLKQARVVKLGEQPYKVVKARPKWDRMTQTVIKDQPLEIFGFWQTQDYEPPTAENGIVPRNAYGNVELFKECMLPKKCAHIKLPGLNRICKKLGIDCANAVIGFDFHQGACHPTYDGFVICEEFVDVVTAAWYQDQEEQERKEQEKYEARVYGNWKKLIKGLITRERVKRKYNV